MTRVALLAALLALEGCTTLAPGAADVVVTRDPLVVRSCQSKGSVTIPDSTDRQAKNAGAAANADTVLITSSKWAPMAYPLGGAPPAQGIAYRCSKG